MTLRLQLHMLLYSSLSPVATNASMISDERYSLGQKYRELAGHYLRLRTGIESGENLPTPSPIPTPRSRTVFAAAKTVKSDRLQLRSPVQMQSHFPTNLTLDLLASYGGNKQNKNLFTISTIFRKSRFCYAPFLDVRMF